ncbi:MAG: glycolate oxidase subunit GlcE [Methyloceanibacter sp.]
MTGNLRLGFHAPQSVGELADLVAEAAHAKIPIEVRGRGSKHEVGRPGQTGSVVSTERLVGISLYEPTELVLSAAAGTPVAEVETVLAERGQQLAFEPIDLGPALGNAPGQASIGGVFATNLSGSRRILAGAARDHLLGVNCVNGWGETFKSGGRVMKNVTGYDLCKAVAGSWGTLAAMTEVTMKVLPVAEEIRTLFCFGLPDRTAVEVMCLCLGTPFEVSGTVHLQGALAGCLSDPDIAKARAAVTAIRVENFPSSVRYRAGRLKERLAAYSPSLELDTARSRAFWEEIRTLRMFQGSDRPLWRISTIPSWAAKLVSIIARTLDVRAVYDWSGGLIWLDTALTSDAGAVEIRRAIAEIGGHATLIRAERATRASVDVFQPLDLGLSALTARLKAAFDPAGILNPGRMYRGV